MTNLTQTRNASPFKPLLWLLGVLASIALITFIATPNLLRSRNAANEAARIGRLRAAAEQAQQEAVAGQRQIVRIVSIELIVSDPTAASSQVEQLASRLGGFVQSSNIGYDTPGTASLVFRIPSEKLDLARNSLREIATKVIHESVETTDVTAQWVDFEANLRNYRAEEAQYLSIMKRSGTIKDTLDVARQLSDVRGRIEQTQAKLKALDQQVELATVNLKLLRQATTAVHWTPWLTITAAFRSGVRDLAEYGEFLAYLAFKIPIILLWALTLALLLAAAWRILRWLWHRLFPAAAAPPLAAGPAQQSS